MCLGGHTPTIMLGHLLIMLSAPSLDYMVLGLAACISFVMQAGCLGKQLGAALLQAWELSGDVGCHCMQVGFCGFCCSSAAWVH
mmetsp:Transcript_20209/g.51185  ORF Transcript_20209/g.51185 Transcript_20209/m.51185 type:complete len:84 (+) Transcript_20209:178-429(+)